MRALVFVFFSSLALAPVTSGAQVATQIFTRADTLRGSNTPERAWWDVTFYDLHVKVNPRDSSITGYTAITYRVVKPAREMQIDLQVPLVIDSVMQDGAELSARRDGNAFFVRLVARQPIGGRKTVAVYYHGKAAISGRETASPVSGSPPRMKDSAPAHGGPARTSTPTSPIASASQSRLRTR